MDAVIKDSLPKIKIRFLSFGSILKRVIQEGCVSAAIDIIKISKIFPDDPIVVGLIFYELFLMLFTINIFTNPL